jgi:hypothetical protein
MRFSPRTGGQLQPAQQLHIPQPEQVAHEHLAILDEERGKIIERSTTRVRVLGKSLAGPSVMVNSQLLPTVKPQVRAHMPTAANEPQPGGTDSASTCESARCAGCSTGAEHRDKIAL